MNRSILIIEDDSLTAELISIILSGAGYLPTVCIDQKEVSRLIDQSAYYAIISDIHMPGKNGLKIFKELSSVHKNKLPPVIFVSGNSDPQIISSAVEAGAFDVIQKPFTKKNILDAVARIASNDTKVIDQLMAIIRDICGISLGADKRALVETRLLRRFRHLDLENIEEYFHYFQRNRENEVAELVSLITTHTTQFFRESGHFDFLIDQFFPKLVAMERSEIRLWSAASSTGEEVYTIAIVWHEFLRTRKTKIKKVPKLIVVGTDIDFNVIEKAKKGIYHSQEIENLSSSLKNRYFDRGSGDLEDYVKVKDFVYNDCRFHTFNLISNDYPDIQFDAIFLRNVLIYFNSNLIKQIIGKLQKCVSTDGLIFLGHSESLSGLNLPIESIGHSIYQTKTEAKNIATKSLGAVNLNPQEKKIRIYIIDDSKTIRTMLKNIFNSDSKFEVVGEAENPTQIKRPLSVDQVDVVTLDIHMPEQDGISYLKSIQGKVHPNVVIISSVVYEDAVTYMNCLELGALDYIEKPKGTDLDLDSQRIKQVITSVANMKPALSFGKMRDHIDLSQLTSIPQYTNLPPSSNSRDLIVVGASTGGVEALRIVLQNMPVNTPPIVIVQHIPEMFSKLFADRLNQVCPIRVSEAIHNEVLEPNHAYIAPGGKQLALRTHMNKLIIAISDDPPVNRHKPSVDFLFDSIVPLLGRLNVCAAILTGMGGDGAKGMLALKQAGAHTIAQDEDSSLVFGMPRVAIELGGAKEIVPLHSIHYHIIQAFKKSSQVA